MVSWERRGKTTRKRAVALIGVNLLRTAFNHKPVHPNECYVMDLANLGISVLQAYLESIPHISKNFEFTNHYFPLLLGESWFFSSPVEEILATDPDIAGLSCYVWNQEAMYALAKELKKAKPGIKIVMGGHIPTVQPRKVLKDHPAVDVAVKGEGEVPFRMILERDFKDLGSIPGIAFRNCGDVVETGPPYFIEDLSLLPSPYVTGLAPREAFRLPHDGSQKVNRIFMEIDRGCPYRCAYCTSIARTIEYRRFPMERIRDELIWAGKNDIEDLFLYSSNIDPRKVNFQELKRNINEIYGASRYRLRFDLDMKAHDAGVLPFFSGLNLYQLSFGIQSIHNRVLRKVHRTPLDLRHLKETIIETSKRYKVHIETMIGLPGDSYEGFRETMDWLLSINEERPDTIGEINVAWTMAVPGTPMHSDPRKYGIRRFHSASLPYIVETDTFSYDEMEKALNYLSEIKEFQRVGWFDMDPRHAFPDTGAVSKLLDYKEFGSQAREYEEEGKIAPVHPEQEELLRGVKSLLAAADFSSNPLNGWSFEKCETSVEGIHLVFSRPGKVQSKILISRRKDSAPAYARSRNYNFSYLAASGVPPDMVFINSLRDMILKMDV